MTMCAAGQTKHETVTQGRSGYGQEVGLSSHSPTDIQRGTKPAGTVQPEEGSTSTSRCSGTMSGYTRQYRTSATHSTTRTEPFFGKTSLNGPLSSRALRTLSPSHFQLPSRQLAHSPEKGIRVIRRPHLRSHPHRPRRRPALVAPSRSSQTIYVGWRV